MTAVFLKILNMSMTAGWLILAVILIRFLFRRMPKSMRCYLWLLVAVRLICPFSIESTMSLIPSTEPVAPEILYDTRPEIDSGIEAVDNVVNPAFSESFESDFGDSANPLQIWIAVAANVWILGMILLTGYAWISYHQIRRKIQISVRAKNNVWICDDIKTPFILGFMRPRIFVPSSMDVTNLEYVIAHEKTHLRRKDHWWKPIGYFLLIVYWFHPLIWPAYILFCRDIELACDECVIKNMTTAEKKAYSTALLECSISRHQIAACPLAFGEVGVKQRIRSVLHYRKPSFWMIIMALIICIVISVGFLTDPESDENPFGATYSVKEILYQAPQYSFIYTLETAPEYTLTSDRILMERYGLESGTSWMSAGGMKEAAYSRTERYEFFDPLNNKAHEVLDQVEKCWRADTYNEADTFYLLMETRKDKLLLAVGHGDKVRWLWELEKESGSYDYEDLEQKIQGKGDEAVQIFALYQVDSILTASCDGEMRSQGVSAGPALIVFEWGRILPEESVVNTRFFNTNSNEIFKFDGLSEENNKINVNENYLIPKLPENSSWIQNPKITELDEKRGMIQYYDSIMEEELTLLYGTKSPLLILENLSYDENQTENWEAWTPNGDHVLIRLQFADREDGKPFVCAEWDYAGMYYAIYGVIDKNADASPIAKTAINIVQHLGGE